MSILIFGNEEIFPKDTEVKNGVIGGLILEYFDPKGRNYIDKIFLITGIPFLLLLIFFIIMYNILLWLGHKENAFFNPFKRIALKIGTLKLNYLNISNTILFKPKTYDPLKTEKYSGSLSIVKIFCGEGNEDEEK